MKILQLTAEHIKKLSVVEITPTGSLVVIAGENEAGKSTVLDAIMMALAGAAAIPPEPVTRGKDKGKIRLDLGDYIVTRTITAGGTGTVKVQNREGAVYPSPQAMLDGLVGKIALDPHAFNVQKPADQRATLMALAGINTDDIDLARKAAYDERTLVNRELVNAKGALSSAHINPEVGTEPESFDAITEELAQADRLAAEAAQVRRKADAAVGQVEGAKTILYAAEQNVLRLKRELDEAETTVTRQLQIVAHLAMTADEANELANLHDRTVPNRDEIRAKIQTVQDRNAKAAENSRHAQAVGLVAACQKKVDRLSETINDLDVEKATTLRGAKLPIQGLGLDENGVTWNDLPFEQASTSIRLRVSVAIGLALQPKLKVLLVRNGNDLDSNNLALLAQTAEEAGCQLWLERIAGGPEGIQTVVIEEGAIKK